MESIEYSCAVKLLKFSKMDKKETFNNFMSVLERKSFVEAYIEVKSIIDWKFKFIDFFDALCCFQYPSLEFLWHLHFLQVMPLETYILNIYCKKDIFVKFQECMIKLYTQDLDDKEEEYLVQTGFLSFFVQKAFPVTDDFDSEKSLEKACLDTIEKLLKDLFSDETDTGSKRYSGFYSLWNAGILEETSLELFCAFAVSYYLKSLPSSSDLEMFEIFENIEQNSSAPHQITLLNKLLKGQRVEKVIHLLKTLVQDLNINAKGILDICRSISDSHPGYLVSTQKLMSEVLNEALDCLSYNLLLRALLIMRQMSYQTNTPQHIAYKNWLQIIFKDNEYLKNVECFLLLIQVLSDIVPFYKSIECLKVAIEFSTSVPKEAQQIYNDYIILLKTRINDLKPQVKAEATVEKILSLYEILGKIPPVIMEASLLQKHKFMDEFLPALLTPRVVPQIPDVKEKFINALYKSGKIPNNLMQVYKKKCQEVQETLISDINMIDDNFDEDSDIILLD